MENNFSIIKDKFKELPNNIEAEQSVIGSILVTNEIFDEINTIISNINFFDPMHQKIFNAVESMMRVLVNSSERSLKDLIEEERKAVKNNSSTKDSLEGMNAFLEKRKPNFNQD